MTPPTAKPQSIDEYIAAFPAPVQAMLQQIRAIIREAAPTATEAIKYAMPTFVLNGNLAYFAAFKQHIGLYGVPTNVTAFEEDLAPYEQGKGSVRFPLTEPLPLDLIVRLVRFRVERNQLKPLKSSRPRSSKSVPANK